MSTDKDFLTKRKIKFGVLLKRKCTMRNCFEESVFSHNFIWYNRWWKPDNTLSSWFGLKTIQKITVFTEKKILI